MRAEELGEMRDRNELYREHFEERQREFLKALVTSELIEEHRRSPLGQHSEALERLLIYFRRQPQLSKYAVVAVEPSRAYRIVLLSGRRGAPPRIVDDAVYGSPIEAYHGVFLRRIQDLLES